MRLIQKLERKFGRFAIPNLMKYVMGLTVLGAALGLIAPNFYYQYLMLDFERIFHGQVWRLITFILYPRISSASLMMDLLFLAIMVYLYYSIGRTLENVWGTFRLNMFIFFGVFLTVVATLIYYLATGYSFCLTESGYWTYADLEQVFQAVILAFAFLFPDAQFLLYFIIPIKAKWLGYLYIAFSVFICFQDYMGGDYLSVLLFVAAYLNFLLFYGVNRSTVSQFSYKRTSPAKKKVRYRNTAQTQESSYQGPRHRCAICGRTEQDNPDLEFRYCSKCDGNFEYCSDHLFTHEHVHRD